MGKSTHWSFSKAKKKSYWDDLKFNKVRSDHRINDSQTIKIKDSYLKGIKYPSIL